MICRIEVFSVPARREINASYDFIAWPRRKASVLNFQSFWSAVYAVENNGSLCKIGIILRPVEKKLKRARKNLSPVVLSNRASITIVTLLTFLFSLSSFSPLPIFLHFYTSLMYCRQSCGIPQEKREVQNCCCIPVSLAYSRKLSSGNI